MSPKTIRQLRRLVTQAGGTLEKDEGYSDMRIFQAVAPEGKLWAGSDLSCLLIHWADGVGRQDKEFNKDAYCDVQDRVSRGLRNMTSEERKDYGLDISS